MNNLQEIWGLQPDLELKSDSESKLLTLTYFLHFG